MFLTSLVVYLATCIEWFVNFRAPVDTLPSATSSKTRAPIQLFTSTSIWCESEVHGTNRLGLFKNALKISCFALLVISYRRGGGGAPRILPVGLPMNYTDVSRWQVG